MLFNYSSFTSFQQQLDVLIQGASKNYLIVDISGPGQPYYPQLKPGQLSYIDLSITDAFGLGGDEYEVALIVVDRAVLDLVPVSLVHFNETEPISDSSMNVW